MLHSRMFTSADAEILYHTNCLRSARERKWLESLANHLEKERKRFEKQAKKKKEHCRRAMNVIRRQQDTIKDRNTTTKELQRQIDEHKEDLEDAHEQLVTQEIQLQHVWGLVRDANVDLEARNVDLQKALSNLATNKQELGATISQKAAEIEMLTQHLETNANSPKIAELNAIIARLRFQQGVNDARLIANNDAITQYQEESETTQQRIMATELMLDSAQRLNATQEAMLAAQASADIKDEVPFPQDHESVSAIHQKLIWSLGMIRKLIEQRKSLIDALQLADTNYAEAQTEIHRFATIAGNEDRSRYTRFDKFKDGDKNVWCHCLSCETSDKVASTVVKMETIYSDEQTFIIQQQNEELKSQNPVFRELRGLIKELESENSQLKLKIDANGTPHINAIEDKGAGTDNQLLGSVKVIEEVYIPEEKDVESVKDIEEPRNTDDYNHVESITQLKKAKDKDLHQGVSEDFKSDCKESQEPEETYSGDPEECDSQISEDDQVDVIVDWHPGTPFLNPIVRNGREQAPIYG
ncbi:hypothetical protein K505DRAFT_365888 [Melanomma pulvis-pyrius CBS 109.77]|uniref:Uncharacterized protein n=1 Tax=Melanomma pulvis-pyrius CBS 109.77 TaxID=1314802 RepID=A0A6A6WZI9_9PLEO|nr:hypothetical protein K505DRAFT_365888 [Melanomma pulvis-pyrius CBS 109.77]